MLKPQPNQVQTQLLQNNADIETNIAFRVSELERKRQELKALKAKLAESESK